MKNITLTPEWKALSQHFSEVANLHLRDLFDNNPDRFKQFSLSSNGILLDYSKNRITEKTLDLLCQLSHAANLQQHIEDLKTGQKINFTEQRAALHTALRNFDNPPLFVDGENIVLTIQSALHKMQNVCESIHQQHWRGFSKKPITDVVNLGIGGSDLGPKMAVEALKPYHLNKVNCHFVSNIDGTDIINTLATLNPETTLFIISSKSFTTLETLTNANTAKKWLLQHDVTTTQLANHFIAVTAEPEKAKQFGIAIENIIAVGNWVGGRYSLWSAVGLPIALSVGMENFIELLRGAHEMDQHFFNAEPHKNMPVLMALLGIWYINFFNFNTHAILTYDESLKYFKTHLQQLDMESNGKQINRNNQPLTCASGPIIWGEIGSNGQHAFHQLLHQGTQTVPADFIVPINTHHPTDHHHDILFSNALSQTRALMYGKTIAEAKQELLNTGLSNEDANKLAKHKTLLGNKPSNTLLLDKVTPYHLGALTALYEHKVFVQSVIWQINAFDQWGVELGKQLAKPILKKLINGDEESLDSSTDALIFHYKLRRAQ